MHHEKRFTVEKIKARLKVLESLVYRKRIPLGNFRLLYLENPPSPEQITDLLQADSTEWTELAPHQYWATKRQNFALRNSFVVPAEFDADNIALYFGLGNAHDFSHPEALLYIDGQPIAAVDRHHQEIQLSAIYADNQTHYIFLPGWSGQNNRDGEHGRLLSKESYVVEIDPVTRQFLVLARVALGTADALDEHNPSRYRLLNALDAAFKLLDLREPFGEHTYTSIKAAYDKLLTTIQAYDDPALPVDIITAGHAHIDLAWLWTTQQTRLKGQRTFHTVLHLMEQFPDYRFTQSQPQLYEWMRQDNPALFERIKAQVQSGQWEAIGGMWVEADCNVPGNEALVRQFVYGMQWFDEAFGKDVASPVLWLPDVFGYSWALPQIMKKCGIDYFMTIKIGWSQYNRLPYDSFWWQGLDGSRVLTHFSTAPEIHSTKASTYNAIVDPEQVLGTWKNFQQKELSQPLLIAYGYGDGGGGPTREMLENIQTLNDFPGMPKLQQNSVINFFRMMETAIEKDAENGVMLPTWNGELYLEYHRATYTTQARTKHGNRRCEIALHNLEFLSAYASILDDNFAYPHDEIRVLWQRLLLNQFHDILPGSSIGEVYTAAEQDYVEILAQASALQHTAIQSLAAFIDGKTIAINPTPVDVYEINTTPRPNADDLNRQPIFWQYDPLTAYSLITQTALQDNDLVHHQVSISPMYLENRGLRIELNAAGDITRIFVKSPYEDDPHGVELLPQGKLANQLVAYDDRPLYWDAWDIDVFYDDTQWLAAPATSITVIEDTPERGTLEIKRSILGASFTQHISLSYDNTITFYMTIDWQEKHKLLKVRFPTTIQGTSGLHEIQWGYVERPTHQNTSWDWAKFETPAQRWVALQEGYRSMALISDSKYGYAVQNGVLEMSLLRGSTWPDPNADQGVHTFGYQLQIMNVTDVVDIIEAAQIFNNPPYIADVASIAKHPETTPQLQFISTDDQELIIETIKRAEDDNGIIVRAYDVGKERRINKIIMGFDIQQVWLCTMREENLQELDIVEQRTFEVANTPHEIITLRIVPA